MIITNAAAFGSRHVTQSFLQCAQVFRALVFFDAVSGRMTTGRRRVPADQVDDRRFVRFEDLEIFVIG
jgi:hypothetical protein